MSGPQIKYEVPALQVSEVDIASCGSVALEALLSFSIALVVQGRVIFSSYPGTSGDTGSAAIESVQGAKNVDIIVLLPQGHCTKIQELQMTTVLRENVHVFGGESWDGGSRESVAASGASVLGDGLEYNWPGDELTILPPAFPLSLASFISHEVGICLGLALGKLLATQFQKLLEGTNAQTITDGITQEVAVEHQTPKNATSVWVHPTGAIYSGRRQTHSLSQVTWVLFQGPELQWTQRHSIIILKECALTW